MLTIKISIIWILFFFILVYMIEFTSISFWYLLIICCLIGTTGSIFTKILVHKNPLDFDSIITLLANSLTIVALFLVNKYQLDQNKLTLLLGKYRDFTRKK